MKNVIEALKNEIKDQVETIRGIRGKINGLKWKPGTEEKVAAVKAKSRPRGNRQDCPTGKADLKPFRWPETGPARAALWTEKRSAGSEARYLMLAYGALRGRAYKQIEPKCAEGNEPVASWIAYHLKDAGITEAQIKGWLAGKPLPLPPRPARPEAAPVAMEASL